jgi:hypothetical protein
MAQCTCDAAERLAKLESKFADWQIRAKAGVDKQRQQLDEARAKADALTAVVADRDQQLSVLQSTLRQSNEARAELESALASANEKLLLSADSAEIRQQYEARISDLELQVQQSATAVVVAPPELVPAAPAADASNDDAAAMMRELSQLRQQLTAAHEQLEANATAANASSSAKSTSDMAHAATQIAALEAAVDEARQHNAALLQQLESAPAAAVAAARVGFEAELKRAVAEAEAATGAAVDDVQSAELQRVLAEKDSQLRLDADARVSQVQSELERVRADYVKFRARSERALSLANATNAEVSAESGDLGRRLKDAETDAARLRETLGVKDNTITALEAQLVDAAVTLQAQAARADSADENLARLRTAFVALNSNDDDTTADGNNDGEGGAVSQFERRARRGSRHSYDGDRDREMKEGGTSDRNAGDIALNDGEDLRAADEENASLRRVVASLRAQLTAMRDSQAERADETQRLEDAMAALNAATARAQRAETEGRTNADLVKQLRATLDRITEERDSAVAALVVHKGSGPQGMGTGRSLRSGGADALDSSQSSFELASLTSASARADASRHRPHPSVSSQNQAGVSTASAAAAAAQSQRQLQQIEMQVQVKDRLLLEAQKELSALRGQVQQLHMQHAVGGHASAPITRRAGSVESASGGAAASAHRSDGDLAHLRSIFVRLLTCERDDICSRLLPVAAQLLSLESSDLATIRAAHPGWVEAAAAARQRANGPGTGPTAATETTLLGSLWGSGEAALSSWTKW